MKLRVSRSERLTVMFRLIASCCDTFSVYHSDDQTAAHELNSPHMKRKQNVTDRSCVLLVFAILQQRSINDKGIVHFVMFYFTNLGEV